MADIQPPLSGYIALWLIYDEETTQTLDELIRNIAKACYRDESQREKHIFGAHETLLSWPGSTEDLEHAQGVILDELVEGEHTFTSEFTGIGQRPIYLQSLFLNVVPTRPLEALRKKACRLAGQPNEFYMPHASLLYGHLPRMAKNQLVNAHTSQIPGQATVVAVSLVFAQGWPSEWETIARFPLTVSPS
jgi:2'-5' RNA ligase